MVLIASNQVITVYVVIYSTFMQCIQHVNYPVKLSCKKYANLAGDFLAGLVRSCTDFACLALKMKLSCKILQSCKNLTRKNCKIIFLQDFDQILQVRILFLAKFLQLRSFISCKKASFLVQDLQDMCKI